MISVPEQPTVTIPRQPAVTTEVDATPGVTRGVNGFRRQQGAVSGLQIAVARERDHYDMARLASGDEQGLDSLMQRHAKRLFTHLERIVKNRTDAAELVQEAFIRVFRHRLDFNFESRFSTWLYVIGSHLAINLLRWRTRHPEFNPLPQDAAECLSADSEVLVDPAPTPREQAEGDEWTDALEQALAKLPPQLREPLLLVSLDSCPQAEVARRLGCTVKAVETRIYHGRKRLRAELESVLNPWRCRVNGAVRLQRPQ